MFLPANIWFLLAASITCATLPPNQCMQDVEDNEQVYMDGPTNDGTAGIGVEFESPEFIFKSKGCSRADTNSAKKKLVAGREGTHFMLTADTSDEVGKLTAEYILNGQAIKVGSGDAAKVAAAAAQDLITWQPWKGTWPVYVGVEDSNCNPWTIEGPSPRTDAAYVSWDAQITTPMPLEAMYFLMKEQWGWRPGGVMNVLNGFESGEVEDDPDADPDDAEPVNLIVVTRDFFQSNTNGIDHSTVSDDVLGFCSWVLSYAKSAPSTALSVNKSPKKFLTFMPRTEFNTMFQQVKSKIPGDLFQLFNSLACYKTIKVTTKTPQADYLVVDTAYCSGSLSSPSPNNKFAALTYKNDLSSVNIKSWIEGIGAGNPSPDLLSAFDATIDGSIGGLGTKTEKMYNSQRSAPLVEFRDRVGTPPANEWASLLDEVDSAIQALHKSYANPPGVKKRDTATSCILSSQISAASTATIPASITAPPTPSCVLHFEDPDQGINQAFCLCDKSITLSPLHATTAQEESCAYKSLPATAVEVVTIQTEIWTTNCAACTVVGGIADQMTCTKVSGCTPTTAPMPTIVAWIGNLSTIDIGNAEDGNGGKDLALEMFGKLKGMCNDSGKNCSGEAQPMDNVEAILAGGEEPLKPAMYLQDVSATSRDAFEMMLSTGISAWVVALNSPDLELCKNVTYHADEDETGSGCGPGPMNPHRLRRKIRRDTSEVLWERPGLAHEEHQLAERCGDNCVHPTQCTYEARICNAPNEVTVVMESGGNPYADHLNIGITLEHDKGFDCNALAAELTAAMIIVAPELMESDIMEGVELEAICGFIDDPAGFLKSAIQLPAAAKAQKTAAVY